MAETVEDLEETLSGIRKALQAVTARSEPSPSAGAAPLQRPAAPAAVAAQRRSPPPPPAALAALAGETPHQRPEPAPTSVQDGHGGFSAAAAIAARMGLAGSAVALVGEPPMAEAPLDIVHAQRQLASKPIVEGGHVFYQRMPTARGTPPQMAEIERRRDADRAPQRDELERDIARLRDDLIACGSELDQKAPMKAIRSEREELAKDIERLRQEKAELESEILETERLNAQSKQTAAADMLRNDFSHAAWGSTNTSSQRTACLVPAASGGKMQEPTSGPNLDTMSAPISVGRPDVGNVLQLPPEYKDYHLHAPSVQSRHEREQELRRPLGIRANRAVPHASQPQVASGPARKNTAPAWANGMSLAEWEALQQQAPQVHSQLDSGAGEQDNLLRAQPHWESARQMSPPAPAPPPPPQMLQQAQQVQQPQPRQQQPSHHHQNYEQDVTQKQPMDQHQKHEQDMVLQQQEFLQHLQHLQSMQGQMRPSEMDIRQQAQTMVGTEGADPQSYGNLHQQPGEPMVVLEVVRSVQHESPTSLKAPVLLQRPKRESDHTHPSVGVTEAPPLLTDPTLEGLQQSPQARQQFPDASTVLGMDPEEYEQQSPEKYGKLWQLVPDGPSSDRNPNIKRYRETDGADEGVYSDYGYSDYHVPIQDGPLNGDDRSTPLASSTSRSFTGDLGLPITCEVIFAEEHKDSHDPDLDAKMGALQHGVHGYVSLPKDITAGYVRTGHTSKELSPEDDRVASMNQLRMEEAALQNQQQPLMQQVTAHTIPGSMRRSIGRLPSLERVDEVVEEDGEDVEEEDSQEHVVNEGRADEPDPALFQQDLSNSPVDQLIEQYAVSPFSSPTKESALALPMRDGPSPPSHSPGQPMHTRSEGEHGLSEGQGDSLVERNSSGFVHRESRDELRGSPDFGPEASASVRESVCDVDVSMYGSSERNVPKSVRPNFSSSRGELQKPQQKEDSCVDSGDISGGEQHHVKARRLQQEPTPGMVEVSALYSKPEEPSPSQDESLRQQSPSAFPTVEDVRPPETEASPPSHLQPLMPSPLFLPENEGAQDYTAFFAAELSVTKGGGKLLDGDVVPPALPFGLHEESDDGEEPVRPLLEAPPPQPMTMPSTEGKLSSEGNISPVPKLPLDTLVPSKQALTVHEAANQLVVEPDSDEEVTERSRSPVPPSMTLPQDGFAHSTQEAAIPAAFIPSNHAQRSVELSGGLVNGAQMVSRLQSPLQAAVERRIEAVQLRASPNDAGAPPLPVLLDQEIGDDIFLEAMGYTPSRPGAQSSSQSSSNTNASARPDLNNSSPKQVRRVASPQTFAVQGLKRREETDENSPIESVLGNIFGTMLFSSNQKRPTLSQSYHQVQGSTRVSSVLGQKARRRTIIETEEVPSDPPPVIRIKYSSASSGSAPRENAETSKNAAGKVTLKPEAEAGPSSGHEDLPTSVSVNL